MRFSAQRGDGKTEAGLSESGGSATGPVLLQHDPTTPLQAATKQYVDNAVGNLYAGQFTSGTVPVTSMPAFTGDVTVPVGSVTGTLSASGVSPGVYPKVTVNTKGIVTDGSTLTESDIPNLDYTKITTGKPTTLSGLGVSGMVSTGDSVMTGALLTTATPTASGHLISKLYVDTAVSGGSGASLVTGDMIKKMTSTTPTGFLKCNGGQVSKAAYSSLYAVVGDVYSPLARVGSGQPWKQQYYISINNAKYIGTWTAGTALPVQFGSPKLVVFSNKVYLIGGSGGTAVYVAGINADGTLGAWTAGPSLPTSLSGCQAIVTSSRIYLIGSDYAPRGSTIYTTLINNDGSLAGWTTGVSLPGSLGLSQAIVTSNRVYLAGGYDGTAWVSTVYTAPINMDGTLGTWSIGTRLPDSLANSQAVLTSNRVYLLGGYDKNANIVSTVYTAPINADGTLGTWTTGSSLPAALCKSKAIITFNRVYLLGGRNSSAPVNDTYSAPIKSDGTLGEWVPSQTLPNVYSDLEAITTSSRVYFMGGVTSTGNSSYDVYSALLTDDFTAVGWKANEYLPGTVSKSQAIVTSNRVYLLGGYNATASANTVYTTTFNTTTGALGTWTTGTSLPATVDSAQAIVTFNRVYLLGGYSSSGSGFLSTVYTAPINADGTLGTWTTGTPLPGPLAYSQAVVTSNRVYLLGGRSGGYVATVYTAPINADGTLGTWTTGTSLPGVLANSQAVVTSNRVYLLGGFDGSARVSTVYTTSINSDGTLGTWTTSTSLPIAVALSQAVVTSNQVYLFGGENPSIGYIDKVYSALINSDGSLGTWVMSNTTLPNNLHSSTIVVTSNRVYLLGGISTNTTTTSIFRLNVNIGVNDYAAYYNGTTTYTLTTPADKFTLPDYSTKELPGSYTYIKT